MDWRGKEPLNPADGMIVDRAMSDPMIPLISAAAFVGVGCLIIHAGRQYDDAIQHTLTVFALVIGMLVLIGVTAKLRSMMGVGRMSHRIEARSQVDQPTSVRVARKPDIGPSQ
ncbi:hypothetical protein ABID82_000539 [Methylobacterium sp. PvP062]|uniref:Uncharacterized protein n=1 Tax=Methylobacterium radiotolerans TaxID=31998 RepID=A0ABV2N9E8_9HYPH|nr:MULTISPECIES: hypothetical protein [unclassified Methylobacterium]MBP2493639.1 hypothetical protein [Methylobacterium sp. PvP105]MBP2499988.1 hypothetical protein [Methylobacterium sp. PvP109]MCX7336316.1 hypothetical protein [Hyphomicrobiales bacterium]